jgi:hypothetical protein
LFLNEARKHEAFSPRFNSFRNLIGADSHDSHGKGMLDSSFSSMKMPPTAAPGKIIIDSFSSSCELRV